jgi:hypothetical protein
MATACLFIGWNRPYPGQNKEAFAYLVKEGSARLEAWKREGFFESSEMFGLTAHGGDLNGFVILKGERAKLDELRRTDAFEKFSMTMGSMFDRYGVVPGVTEEGMKKVMERNPDMGKM